jgi:hypothetical protein
VSFGPFRLHSYSCSRQRFFGLPIVPFPCGLNRYDFKEIRVCGILCRCKSQFLLYPSNLSSVYSVCSSRRVFYGRKRRGLPEASIISFLPPQFFVSVRLSRSVFLTHSYSHSTNFYYVHSPSLDLPTCLPYLSESVSEISNSDVIPLCIIQENKMAFNLGGDQERALA